MHLSLDIFIVMTDCLTLSGPSVCILKACNNFFYSVFPQELVVLSGTMQPVQ